MKKIRINEKGRIPGDEGGDEFYGYIEDLARHPAVLEMKDYMQHGMTSCYQHCLNVAYYNYRVCKHFGLDARSAARAGMIHDLFLYDWHTHARETGEYFHGFTHPGTALRNAREYFTLTPLEEEIIVKHMWPLTPRPPVKAESLVICMTDKYCGFWETVGDRHKMLYRRFALYRKLLRMVLGPGYSPGV